MVRVGGIEGPRCRHKALSIRTIRVHVGDGRVQLRDERITER